MAAKLSRNWCHEKIALVKKPKTEMNVLQYLQVFAVPLLRTAKIMHSISHSRKYFHDEETDVPKSKSASKITTAIIHSNEKAYGSKKYYSQPANQIRHDNEQSKRSFAASSTGLTRARNTTRLMLTAYAQKIKRMFWSSRLKADFNAVNKRNVFTANISMHQHYVVFVQKPQQLQLMNSPDKQQRTIRSLSLQASHD